MIFVEAAPQETPPGKDKPDNEKKPEKEECTTTILGPMDYTGDLVVPEGMSCNLYAMNGDITVAGDIKVASGASLTVWGMYGSSYSTIVDGSITSNSAYDVRVHYTTILGDVQIKDSTFGAVLTDSDITGNVNFNGNQMEYSVHDNDIGGNLQCKNNTPPAVDTFGDNTVTGKITGECKDLFP